MLKVNDTTVGSSPRSPGSSPDTRQPSSGGSSITESAGDAHDRFSVLDVKIGMLVDGDGFTCEKATDGEDRYCVKFLDKRCSGQPLHVGRKDYGDKAPLGCFFDPSGRASFLDGALMQESSAVRAGEKGAKSHPERRPLTVLLVVGTKSRPSKIYRMEYQFEYDDLTPDSKLSKALVAKYGEPSSPDATRWKSDSTETRVECSYLNCNLSVEDSHYEEVENRKQEEQDGAARRKNAPTPHL
ncbi:MAG: hypothetical protein ABI678_09055 [Kofleriaceae bacterium]